MDLTGKTALITGASSGLGVQFARCLSAAGARVIVSARRLDKLKSLANVLGNALTQEMDISDKKSIKKAFEQFEISNEKIDICINNAAIVKDTPIFEQDEDNEFENVIQTNLIGTWYVTKAVANHMKQYGIYGSIINIGSVNGDILPYGKASAYSMSKAAIMHLTKSLVSELSPHHIRINTINPGHFPTERKDDDLMNAILNKIPLAFLPELSDLDSTILYLASNEASRYVTGSTITIDGGLSWAE